MKYGNKLHQSFNKAVGFIENKLWPIKSGSNEYKAGINVYVQAETMEDADELILRGVDLMMGQGIQVISWSGHEYKEKDIIKHNNENT